MRNDTAGNSFTGTPTIAIDNAWNYNGVQLWWCNQDFTAQNNGAALITVNATTGKVTAGTGVLDFENPLDKGYNNTYDFTVTYTVLTEKRLLKQLRLQ